MPKNQEKLPVPKEPVMLKKPVGRPLFRLLAFVVCVAVLVAAFAVSGIWTHFGIPVTSFFEGVFHRNRETTVTGQKQNGEQSNDEKLPEQVPEQTAPENAVPVVLKTLFEPFQEKKDEVEMQAPDFLKNDSPPVVFVYCTNPNQAYLSDPDCLGGDITEQFFSNDSEKTVEAVALAFLDVLHENGIQTLYGKPAAGEGYLGATERAATLLEKAMQNEPQITLAVQIGRDSILNENGNYIKSATGNQSESMAQVLAVIGSEDGGKSFSQWQENFMLAEWLCQCGNQNIPGLFRGVRVKSTSQNQQFAPHSLSFVIGTGVNSLEEACRSAAEVGNILSGLLKGQ